MRFRGNSSLTLDTKGRLSMPARHREVLREICEGNLVVTPDFTQSHLNIYPLPVWEAIEEQLDRISTFDRQGMRLKYIMQGNANEVEMDASGRLLLPPKLREMVGLDKSAVLIGMGKRFELWDESKWQAQWDAFAQETIESGEISETMKLLEL